MSNSNQVDPREGFEGVVSTTEPIATPDGTMQTHTIAGYVKIRPAEDAGIPPARGDTPWMAEVSGPTTTVWIPGCRVQAVSKHKPVDGAAIWRVP